MSTTRQALLDSLPPEWPEDLLPHIQAGVRASGAKLVVLDDDPTGNQTVHDVDVMTDWSVPMLVAALNNPEPVVYLLTNTRSMPLTQAQALNREIAGNLVEAQATVGRRFAIVSRSDSTLRGHYPGEIQALSDALGTQFDATLIVPFFTEGGRITAHDIHYVTEGDHLTPAAETEYARDPVFGYTSANLREWVSEKHSGVLSQDEVASITLDEIRVGGPPVVKRRLAGLCERRSASPVCIVNAVTYRDLEVVVAALLEAEAEGCRFLYRTAASFVRVRGGITPRPLLTQHELATDDGTGGLVIVGSHVQKTTRQLEAALALHHVVGIQLPVLDLLNETRRPGAIAAFAHRATEAIDGGLVAVVYTSREVITRTETGDSLQIGRLISEALVEVVKGVRRRPGWMIAKGGITSSDVATDALNVSRARVLGQAIPGVPVWRTGPESTWPGLTYVVFPGNVGDDPALARMIEVLR